MAKVYTLTAQNYQVQIVPEYGMNCIKAVCIKPYADILRTPSDIDILKNDDAFLFGMPILFFPNRISNGKFEFEGREYTFPINEPKLNNFCHGDLHKMPFEVIESNNEHIKGVFAATADTPYLTFPHYFEFCVEYSIKQNGIYQVVSIKNTTDKNMPVALGFHTTFNVSRQNRIKIPAKREVERDFKTFLPTGVICENFKLKRELNNGEFKLYEKPISKLFELGGNQVQIYNEKSKTSIIYFFDEKYKYCMLYSNDGKSNVCIEPQTWITNCPNLNVNRYECGFDFIAPGKIKEYTSILQVKKEGINKSLKSADIGFLRLFCLQDFFQKK